jgi:hypothetical protein
MTYLLTWRSGPCGNQVLWMLGEIVQPVKPPAQHVTQVLYLVLNYTIYQGQVKHIIIMNMNKHIINHRKQLMEVGGRERIVPIRMVTSLIHPLLKRATIYRLLILW